MAQLVEQDSGKAARILAAARESLAAVDEMIELFSTDPDAARPHRFCPVLVRTALLGEPTAGAAEVRATAEEGLRLPHARRADVLASITTTKE
ncbi:hypothetical protein [Crossiella sp. NPDC003009]